MKKFLLVSMVVMVSALSFAKAPTAKQAFAELKKLVGTWEMKSDDGTSFKVNYRVTGGGSALVETQFVGLPHEMVSIYHMDGEKLIMTHYCAAGNQPTMIYKPGKSIKVLDFDFLRGSNMKRTDVHIHSAKIQLTSGNQIQSDWTSWDKGKKGGTAVFKLKRVPQASVN